jgi:hypothetical protein
MPSCPRPCDPWLAPQTITKLAASTPKLHLSAWPTGDCLGLATGVTDRKPVLATLQVMSTNGGIDAILPTLIRSLVGATDNHQTGSTYTQIAPICLADG